MNLSVGKYELLIGTSKTSGVPAVYSTHQEIMLELFTKWA